jgi:hypothetical protein
VWANPHLTMKAIWNDLTFLDCKATDPSSARAQGAMLAETVEATKSLIPRAEAMTNFDLTNDCPAEPRRRNEARDDPARST